MKTVRYIFPCLAALTAISCARTELPEQPENRSTVHFSTTLPAKEPSTKSMDADGHTAWQVGEELSIRYQEASSDGMKSLTSIATVTAVYADGSATIEATLEDAKNGGKATLFCPAPMFYTSGKIKYSSLRKNQKGTLEDIIAHYDATSGHGRLVVSDTEATLAGTFEMTNHICICRFRLRIGTPGDGDTFTPSADDFTTLTITTSGGSTYTITSDRDGGTRGFMDGDDIYVAMEPIESEQLTFMVSRTDDATGDKVGFGHITAEGTLAAGKMYTNIPITLRPVTYETIEIPAGGSLTLKNNVIHATDGPAIKCLGDATLIIEGLNDISVTTTTTTQFYSAIQAGPAGSTLTIQGTGSLTAEGSKRSAAVGSGWETTCGDITIESGTLIVKGGSSSGVGIGSGLKGVCGQITINGGTVKASGGSQGAGIGSVQNGTCGDITINGGDITATGGDQAAGIGAGGSYGSCGNIIINGGLVNAMSENNCVGIGTGKKSSCGDITISGGHITATGEGHGAGIGRFDNSSPCGDITISNATGTVTKGENAIYSIVSDNTVNIDGAPGKVMASPYFLGNVEKLADGNELSGVVSDGRRVIIEAGATVTLNGVTINNSHPWPGITCLGNATIVLEGSNSVITTTNYYSGILPAKGKTLTIQGTGSLEVAGGRFSAGIGSGFNKAEYKGEEIGNIIIAGGTVTAAGGLDGAAIGTGKYGSCGNITISGGNVNATGGISSAGIGNGYGSEYHRTVCGAITISGGTVNACGGSKGAGIGNGYKGDCGAITISGGSVTATSESLAAAIGNGYSSSFESLTIGSGITSVQATIGSSGGTTKWPIGFGVEDAGSGSIILDGVTLTELNSRQLYGQIPLPELPNLDWVISTIRFTRDTWTLTPKQP